MPSSKVDLPEPFSPTNNVTGTSSARVESVRMTGTENGNTSSASAGATSRFSETSRRWASPGKKVTPRVLRPHDGREHRCVSTTVLFPHDGRRPRTGTLPIEP